MKLIKDHKIKHFRKRRYWNRAILGIKIKRSLEKLNSDDKIDEIQFFWLLDHKIALS